MQKNKIKINCLDVLLKHKIKIPSKNLKNASIPNYNH